MRFYTNVKMIGNRFLVRGYENGESVKFKEEYSPTLFVKSKKETEYKTLEGEYVKAVQPGSVKESREFLDEYKDCLLYTSPSPRDRTRSRMPSSA